MNADRHLSVHKQPISPLIPPNEQPNCQNTPLNFERPIPSGNLAEIMPLKRFLALDPLHAFLACVLQQLGLADLPVRRPPLLELLCSLLNTVALPNGLWPKIESFFEQHFLLTPNIFNLFHCTMN